MSNFSHEVNKNVSVIHMPQILGRIEANEFKENMNAWLLSPVEMFILDYKNTQTIEQPFYQIFLQFRSILKNNSKHLFSIGLKDYLLKQIRADGLEDAFSAITNVADAQKKVGLIQQSRNKIDLSFITPFLKGAKSAFEIQCNTPIQPQKPYIKTSPVENIAIAGVLSLMSDNFQGTVILSFPEKVFLKIYENMFGEEQKEITTESEDAAAELLNIIYGAAKVELNNNGFNFPRSLPTILRGKGLLIRQTSNATTVVLPFESSAGVFYLEIECEKS